MWLAIVSCCAKDIVITLPAQLPAQLTHFRLFVHANEHAQRLIDDGAFGFDTGQFLRPLDERFIEHNGGSQGSLQCV